MLRPLVGLAAEGDVLALVLPRGDRGEEDGAGIGARRPAVEHDGRARRPPREALERHGAVGRAQVLAVGEEDVVARQETERGLLAGGDAELLVDRVGLDVEELRPPAVLLARRRGPAQVHDRGRVAVEGVELRAREAVRLAVHQVDVRPAVGEADPAHHVGHVADRGRAVLGRRAEPRVVGRRARVLDVPDVPAELVEAAQVVDRLPRHARHRVLPEDAEDEERLRTTRHGPAPPRTGCGGDARTARRARRAPRTCPARRCARRRGPGSRPPAGPSRAGAR